MSHFAKLDNNIVTEVIVAEQDFINSGVVGDSFLWVQTSYNGTIRHNFAGEGYTWDETNDAFYAPQPYASWSLNENYIWEAPVPYPEDDNIYDWNEENQEWKLVELTIE